MGKSDLNKAILEQIEKAINPERNLGTVAVRSPKVLRYQPISVIDNPQGLSLSWQKKYYHFNRGAVADLDNKTVFNWTGKLFRGRVTAENGNFIDDGFEPLVNIHYAVEVFADEAKTVNLELSSGQSSIALYLNSTKVYTSGTNYFQSGNRSLDLIQGWNRIDIFYYRQLSDGFLQIGGDLGTHISAWRDVDFTPPQAPQWRDTNPIITEYVDPDSFGAMQNVLFWKKFPVDSEEDVDTFAHDIFAWECYRSEKIPLINLAGNNITVVSGWGNDGVVVSGDLRTVTPAGNSIYLDMYYTPIDIVEEEFTISGSSYPVDTNKTLISISGTFTSPSYPNPGSNVQVDKFTRVWGYPYDDTLPFIVSGLDPLVQYGEQYKYLLKARDAVFGNRSDASEIQTITVIDSAAPGHVTNLNNIRIFNNVVLYFNIPADPDLKGFKVYQDSVSFPNFITAVSVDNPAIDGTSYFSIIISKDSSNTLLDPQTQYTFVVTPFDYRHNENTTTPPDTTTGFGTIFGGMSGFDTGTGFFLGYDGTDHVFSIGDGSGQSIRWDGTTLVTSGSIIDAPGTGSDPAILSWQYDTDFYAEDYNTVGWGAGTLTFNDSSTFSIISGNTGAMSDVTYIYFDKDTSETVLQTTTTASTAVGSGKVLIVTGKNVSDVNKKAIFQEFGGQGSQGLFITAENIAANTITANEIAANTITATEIAAGTITADLLSVTELSAITADMGSLTAGDITLDSSGFIKAGQSAYDTGSGFWLGYDSTAYKFSIGDGSGSGLTWDGSNLTISGSAVYNFAVGTEVGIQGWQYDGPFGVSDYEIVVWGAGTLTLLDGTTYSISAGSTGSMSALTYIYFDKAVSTTAFQVSTTASDAVGTGKILIGVAQNNSDVSKLATYQIFGGIGGTHPTVSGSNIVADSITGNEIAANTITAGEIEAGTITATEIAAEAITASEISAGSITGAAIAANSISGTHITAGEITSDKLTVSQLSAITADMGSLTAGDVTLDTSGYVRGGQTAYDTGTGFFLGYSGGAYKFSIGDGTKSLLWDGSDLYVNDSILTDLQQGSEIGIQGWQYDGSFGVSDYRVVVWGAGTLTLLDGTTYSISIGGTGNMSARTFIYFDSAISTTAFQTTTTASSAVGSGRILIGVAENNLDTGKLATYQIFSGIGGTHPIISGSNVVADSITANEIAANTITASEIEAGTITATEMNVSQLSAISADIGNVTAGNITGNLITGGSLQTASSGQRVVISGADNNLVFYNSSNYDVITLDDNLGPGSDPGMEIKGGVFYLQDDAVGDVNYIYGITGHLSVNRSNDDDTAGTNKYDLISANLASSPLEGDVKLFSAISQRAGSSLFWGQGYNQSGDEPRFDVKGQADDVISYGEMWLQRMRSTISGTLLIDNFNHGDNDLKALNALEVSGTSQFYTSNNFIYMERDTAGLILNLRNAATSSNLFIGGEGPQTIYLTGGSGDDMRFAANSSAEDHIAINTSGDVFMQNSLTVSGTALTISHPTAPILRLQNSTGSNPVRAGEIYFGEGIGGDQFSIVHNGLTNELAFKTNTTGQVLSMTRDTKLLVISGSLGIGKSPSEELDVSGKIHCSEQIRGTSALETFPQFSKVDDTDTGVGFPAADALSLCTAGSRRVYVNSTGLAIGGGTPTGALHIDNTGESSGYGTYVDTSYTTTADANWTTIHTIATATNIAYHVVADFIMIDPDGSSNAYTRRFHAKNKDGTLTLIATDSTWTSEQVALGDVQAAVSSTNLLIQVKGNSNDEEWQVTLYISRVAGA
jgi:hypothetical protein